MRQQSGITLIEIMLVAVIVAAGIVGAFIFAAKTRVSAAVEREQKEVATIVRAVEGSFTFLPNFGALGTEGATYLRDHSRGSGLRYGVDGTRATLITTLGDGNATVDLAAARVDAPNGTPGVANNGYTLTYRGAKPAECVGLVGATAARTTRIDLLPPDSGTGELVASNGRVSGDKGQIARLCAQGAVLRLSFAPARAIVASPASNTLPSARCNPVRERQLATCPTGQSGSITQERVGTCTGANNSLIYMAWTTTETNCHNAGDAPPDQAPDTLPPACGLSLITRAQNCPIGQVGQIVQRRTIDTCRGITPPWEEVSNSCQAPATGCTPSFDRITRPVACPNAGGHQVQELTRTSACLAGVEVWPEWSAPNTISSNCQASCVDAGNCCVPDRQIRPAAQCPAGTWGVGQEERYRGCLNATTAADWSEYRPLMGTLSCQACPRETESETRWQVQEMACPTGQGGMIAREVERIRTRTTTRDCPAGTTTLPQASTSPWSEWNDTGLVRNESNTCSTNTCPALPPAAAQFPTVSQPYAWWQDYIFAFRTWRTGDNQTPPPDPCTAANIGQQALVHANISAPANFCSATNRTGVNDSRHICTPTGWQMISYRPISTCDNTTVSPRADLGGEFMGEQFMEYMDLVRVLTPRPSSAHPDDDLWATHQWTVWHRDAARRPNALVAYGCRRFQHSW